MSQNRQIYLLDPHNLSPETIAVTFAKTSRSPQSFQEIADELTDEKSAEFHEKWVVGYGHGSVAEHAVLHLAVENVSRLAIECLESNRLASYTEKSTRYQKWDEDSFFIPEELDEEPALKQKYIDTNRFLFETYKKSLPVVRAEISRHSPQKAGESEAAFERRIRSDYVDVCRFLLPSSALANVGMTINARALEHAIRKMLTHPLQEVQKMGLEIKKVSQNNVPTLVKYADEVPHWANVANSFRDISKEVSSNISDQDWCQLVHYDMDAHKLILAGLLYRFGTRGFHDTLNYVNQLTDAEIKSLTERVVYELGEHDIPLRELEYAAFTFDLMMDQGAYFEIKRHRMMTQTPQRISTLFGYAVPKSMVAAGFENEYHQAMRLAHETYLDIAKWNPEVAGYIVPNGYNRKLLLKANLRGLEHLINLRSADNAHFSVRRVVQRMADELSNANPLLAVWIRKNTNETWQSIEKEYFTETACQA